MARNNNNLQPNTDHILYLFHFTIEQTIKVDNKIQCVSEKVHTDRKCQCSALCASREIAPVPFVCLLSPLSSLPQFSESRVHFLICFAGIRKAKCDYNCDVFRFPCSTRRARMHSMSQKWVLRKWNVRVRFLIPM